MSASAKFDMSSGSSDKLIYTPRVSSMSAPLDKSGSFRENSASLAKDNVKNFLDSLSFDPKSVSVNYKFSGQVKFKRLISGTLGLQVDDSATNISNNMLSPSPAPSPENLKRLKNGLRESSTKAKERLKTFNGAMSMMNKCFPVIPSRKRSRLDVSSSERATASVSSERSVVGSSSGKTGTQTCTIASGFEPEPQLSEEIGKIIGPNKRTRTSMVDSRTELRGGTPARSSGNMDREVLRPPSTNSVNGELSVGVDNWVKPKMKKKRSGIKSDVSLSSVATKLTEAKQGMQPRHLFDARPRLNDSHAFRSGVPSVSGGVEKADSPMQSTSSGQDRRDRSASIEKERVNIGAINRTNSKEDLNSPSPTSNTKLRAPARAPRSGPKVLQKSSPVVQGTTVSSEWELSHSNSRKHELPAQSSSPPVTQWGSQRPQKLSRIAKRTNFVPISNDENPVLNGTSDITGNETGSSSKIRISSNFQQQFKVKGDQFSSPVLSESEVDERESPRLQKVSNLPPRKNKKLHEGSDNGDGIHKKGRSGRGFTSARTLIPITGENAGNLGTAKQLRSARTGLEKTESKVGRPPTRKLSDRKPFTKQKQTTITAATYFHDDGNEELLAAAAAVIDPALCFSSSFWRQMEPYFCFISDPDLVYLKQQGHPVHPILYTCTTKADRERNRMESPVLSPDVAPPSSDVPLSQRILSALITEEDCDEFSDDELEFDVEQIKFDLQKLENGYELRANGSSINDLDHVLLDTNMVLEKELISDLEILENNFISVQTMEIDNDSSEFEYSNMSFDEKIVMELESVGISVQLPDLTQTADEAIEEIGRLKDKHLRLVSTAKEVFVDKLFSSASETRDVQEKEFERHALNKLLAIAYEKYMQASWGSSTSGVKNTSNKMAKQAALAFVKRTLDHCHQFEESGKSCFGVEFFRNIFISGSARLRDAPLLDGTHRSSIVHSSEQLIGKDDSWLNNGVVGTIGTPSGFVGSLSINAKGKRSDRDREGKGSREVKVGRPTGNVKGERKNKTKPKHKITQSLASGHINSYLEQPEATSCPSSSETMKRGNVQEDDFLEDPIDLSHLQLPGMDDIDGQGQDFGSWLNIDDELPDQDGFDGLEGLEIPMDDLADLNFKF